MAALRECRECDGFLPPRANTCPHCGTAVKPRKGFLRNLRRQLFAVTGGGAVAVTLMACYGATYRAPPPQAATQQPTMAQECEASETDKDGDCVQADQDCNDNDPAIKPGVADQLGDNIDQNCDGQDGVAAPVD
jgi:hypothetical protein